MTRQLRPDIFGRIAIVALGMFGVIIALSGRSPSFGHLNTGSIAFVMLAFFWFSSKHVGEDSDRYGSIGIASISTAWLLSAVQSGLDFVEVVQVALIIHFNSESLLDLSPESIRNLVYYIPTFSATLALSTGMISGLLLGMGIRMFVTLGISLLVVVFSEIHYEAETICAHLAVLGGVGLSEMCLAGGIGGGFTEPSNVSHEKWIDFLYGPVIGLIIFDLWRLRPYNHPFTNLEAEDGLSN